MLGDAPGRLVSASLRNGLPVKLSNSARER
jgi:hypothetical protein